MTIRAVLFDLGNTLWHFPKMPPVEVIRGETVCRIADLLRAWGVDPGPFFFLGRDIRVAIEETTDAARWGDLVSPDYLALARQAAADMGLHLSDKQTAQLWRTWKLDGVFIGRELFPHAVETLRWLKERGYLIGSVTNRWFGGPPFRDELDHYGLSPYFDALSISCEVGYLKPHPLIFQHALKELGVAPEEAVMVGDSLRADVAGSKALNITAVWKRDHIEKDVENGLTTSEDDDTSPSAQPDFTIDDLWEITALPFFQP